MRNAKQNKLNQLIWTENKLAATECEKTRNELLNTIRTIEAELYRTCGYKSEGYFSAKGLI